MRILKELREVFCAVEMAELGHEGAAAKIGNGGGIGGRGEARHHAIRHNATSLAALRDQPSFSAFTLV
jgi:hypothetical protein